MSLSVGRTASVVAAKDATDGEAEDVAGTVGHVTDALSDEVRPAKAGDGAKLLLQRCERLGGQLVAVELVVGPDLVALLGGPVLRIARSNAISANGR